MYKPKTLFLDISWWKRLNDQLNIDDLCKGSVFNMVTIYGGFLFTLCRHYINIQREGEEEREIHNYIHTYTHADIKWRYIRQFSVNACLYTCTHTYIIYIWVCACIYTCIFHQLVHMSWYCECICVCVCSYSKYQGTYANILYIHVYIRARTHTHTHIYMHIQ